MSTLAHDVTRWTADQWENAYPSAVVSGIVGDTAHALRGGYHISIQDQTNPANYSVVRPDDKAPPGSWPRNLAAGIDVNMNAHDMALCWERIYRVWADLTDPRRKYLNAFNGWDGVGSADRLDFVANTRTTSSDDHKWHNHLEIRRRWVTSMDAARAIVSIVTGDDMSLTTQDITDIWTRDTDPDAETVEPAWVALHEARTQAAAAVTATGELEVKVDALTVMVQQLLDRPAGSGGDASGPYTVAGELTLTSAPTPSGP